MQSIQIPLVLWVVLALVALGGLTVIAICRKKQNGIL